MHKKKTQSTCDKILEDISRIGHKLNTSTLSYSQYRSNGGKYDNSDFDDDYGSFASAAERCGFKSSP